VEGGVEVGGAGDLGVEGAVALPLVLDEAHPSFRSEVDAALCEVRYKWRDRAGASKGAVI
jgi:hypothetical protein